MYSLYLYFLSLSFRNTSKALVIFKDNKRSHVYVWNLIQRFGSCNIYKRKRVSAFIIDETILQIGGQHFGYGYVLNQLTNLCLESTFQKRETCFLLKDLSDLLYPNIENILYIQMELLGMVKHTMS
jgi:hypothetical protein